MWWLVCFALSCLCCVNCDHSNWLYHIKLFPSSQHNTTEGCVQCSSSTDHDNCWNCYSLEESLAKANQLKSSIHIEMQSPGPFDLKQLVVVKDVSSFALVASKTVTNYDIAVVSCPDGKAGLSFNRSANILLENIEFTGCGAPQYSSTTTAASLLSKSNDDFQFIEFPVSLYFLSCTAVTIEHVVVQESPGVGLALLNTVGKVVISNSTFSNNGYESKYGGGVVIEHSLCVPGDFNLCITSNQTEVSKVELSVTSCSFTNNLAGAMDIPPLHNTGKDYFGFGKGGGLNLVLKGSTQNNVITLSNLNFTNNTAQYGGSLYVAFFDSTSSNIVTLEQSLITDSTAKVTKDGIGAVQTSEGGGALLMYGSLSNKFVGKSIIFSNNIAQSNGGSLSVHSTITATSDVSANPSMLSLQDVSIHWSSARIGAAAYFITHYPSSIPISTNITSSQFNYNNLHVMCSSPGVSPCTATIYSGNYPLNFVGEGNQFKGNTASGLEIHGSTLTFVKQSETYFEGNRAGNGGGILLKDCARIRVDVKASLHFIRNSAMYKGGGIAVSDCSAFYDNFPILGSTECFIEEMNDGLHQSKDSDGIIIFDNNFAGGSVNAIHNEQLVSCLQSDKEGSVLESLESSVLCASALTYKPSGYNCTSQITSGTFYLDVSLPNKNLQVFPGQSFNLTVNAYDIYSQRIVEHVKVCVKDGPGSLFETDSMGTKCLYNQVSSNMIPLTVYSNEDNCRSSANGTILLSVTGLSSSSSVEVITPIEMVSCPEHTNFSCPKCYLRVDQSHGVACGNPEYCNLDDSPNSDKCPLTFSLKISKVHCWNYVNDINANASVLSQFAGGMCPYNYRTKFCELISDFTFENRPPACPANRQGRLCGKCDSNHGIAVNTGDMECIACYYPLFPMWAAYLAIEFIYATILFLLVILTKLSLNAGGTNAFIFYCQVITMKFPGLSYPSWVLEKEYDYAYKYTTARGFTVIYSIANLDFIIPFAEPFCLSKTLTPIHAITLEYIPAVYLLLLTALVYCWVLLHKNYCNVIYRVTNLVIRNNEGGRSGCRCRYGVSNYFQSLAVIVVLCYTRIVTTSVKFLHATDYYNLQGKSLGKAFFYDGTLDYFGDEHAVYATVALLVLGVFIFLPSLFLTVYPLVQSFIYPQCCNSFLSTGSFTDCFKDGLQNTKDHRYFAGIYLLLRIIVAFLYLERDIESLLISQISVAIVAASLFMTLRPYKQDMHNTVDGLLFVYLALLSGLSANGYYTVCQRFLIHVPLAIIIAYAVIELVKLLARFRLRRTGNLEGNIHQQVDSDDESLLNPEENGSDVEATFTHRLLNPQRYVADQQRNKRKRRSVALLNMST